MPADFPVEAAAKRLNPYLFPGLERSPQIMRDLFALIPGDLLDVPTYPERFTPREVIAHLADWESVLRDERLVEPARNPGCAVSAYDEGDRAIDRGYSGLDVATQLEIFAAERAKTIAFLKGLDPEAWLATMVHPERGEMTVSDVANSLVGHDAYHVEQLVHVIAPRS